MMSLSIAEASRVATTHLQSLFPTAESLSLEEVEISDDDRFWLITLGFQEAIMVKGLPQRLGDNARKYKIFKINRETGEVRSMKIRERENV
jgi:hypothetical protein